LKVATVLLLIAVICGFNSDSSNRVNDSLLQLLNKTDNPSLQAGILRQLSSEAFSKADYYSAIQYLNDEIKLNNVSGDSVAWANAQYSLGMISGIVMRYNDAEMHAVLAKEFFEKNRMFRQVANSCINLGYIYNEQNKPDLAEQAYLRAMGILEEQISERKLESTYLNLGIIGNQSGDNKSNSVNKAPALSDQDKLLLVSLLDVYTNMGVLYLNIGNFNSSEMLLDKALKLAQQQGARDYTATAMISLGVVYHRTGRLPEAYAALQAGMDIASSMGLKKILMQGYAELARVAMQQNKPVLAYNYLSTYTQLKDSLYKDQIASQIGVVQQRFDISLKALDSERLIRENLEQSLKIEKSKNSRIALFASVVVLLILLAVFYKRYSLKTRSTEKLIEANQEVEHQKMELEQLIQTKDRFLSIIAHDLKNPFTSLLGFADLAYTEFDEITEEEKRSYLGIIRQSSQHIYSLLDNLLTWSRAQSGRIDFNPELVNLLEVVDFSIDLVRSAAENKNISLFTEFTRDVKVRADKNMLATVLRNLLSNAIKFTPAGGSVTVTCNVADGRANLSVSDTGIGLSKDELSRLFKIDGNLKNPGTNNETGTGLGLILCQEFMNIHKSRITAQSSPGQGSIFSFSLEMV